MRILFTVKRKQGGVGSTVYYTDVYDADKGSFNANIQSMGFSSLLDTMKSGGQGRYNMLFLGPNTEYL
jgi:hypothetical protein